MGQPQMPRPAPHIAAHRFGRRTWLTIIAVLALVGTVGGAIFASGTSTVIVELATLGNIPEDAGNARFTIRLSDPITDGQVTVTARTISGTGPNGAVAGADFTFTEQTFIFTVADQAPREFLVPIIDDAIDELNETFDVALVDLTNTSSTTIFLAQPFTAVIGDNDSPTFTSITGPSSVDEGAGVATFTVTMAQSSPQPITFQWQVVGSGADPITVPPAAGADVSAASGTWIIPANRPAGTTTFNIGIINDTIPEANEQFRLQITAVTNVANPAAALATDILVTILDNDGAPNIITNTGLTVDEGASGTIAQSNLQATDGQQGPAEVIFAITTLPVNGTLFRDGVELELNGTFTQQDIADNLISYTHDGSETTGDSFAFTVSDGFTPVGPETFTITITPLNDAPAFDPDTYSATIAEDAAGGSAVVTVTATDIDAGDTLTYSITGGNTGTAFTIDPTSGAITVSDPSVLDFETTPSYTLTVTVTDADGLTDTATVTITITNVNDAPVFDPDTYSATIAEDAAGGSAVVTVTATDIDAGDTLTYSITGGNTGTAFTIDETTGEITVSDPSVLDFETTPSYTLTVTVTDADGLTDTATVTITITDANDAPVFDPDTYSATIAEDAAGGAAVTTVTATDIDAGDTLTYSITGGNTGTAFTIDPTSGAITVSDPSVLDFETTPSYTLTVTVTDADGLTDTATVTVTITDANDAPVFAPDTYTATIAEDAAPASAVVTVTATDPDAGDTLTYSITGGNTGTAFTIDPTSGAITVSDPSVLDFETTPSYTITVTVTDADGLTDTATVTITITDANDAPVFAPDTYTATIAEDAAPASAVVTVTATDPDAGDTLTYSITGGNTGTAFTIDPTSGAITVSDPSVLDFETTPSYTLTVTVTDADGLTDTATVTITITDANDAPVFAPDTYTATIAEDAAPASAVVTVTATDPDAGDTLTYSITGGNTGTAFTIDPTSGAITVSDPSVLDFETTPSYTLDVTVTDPDGLTDTATVTITITNVNEAPVFAPDTYSATIAEDAAGGSAVVTVTATDPDAGDTLTYSITGGNTGTAFTIDPTSGAITVSDPSVLDFETTPSYTLTVTVTDADGLTDTATVTITITDANDPPTANDDTYTVAEETTLNVGSPGVLDNDTDIETPSALTVVAVNGTPFTTSTTVTTAEGGTLFIRANGSFDYTPATDFVGDDTFTYTVSDPDGATDTATVTITVTNVNDAPTIAVNTGLTVAEGGAADITSTQLAAADIDNTPAELSFLVLSAPARGELLLNGTALSAGETFTQADIDAGDLSYAHNGSETPLTDSFQFLVSDLDGETAGPATFTITITPVNDAPVVDANGAAAGIDYTVPTAYAEGQATPLAIVDPALTVTDADTTTLARVDVTIDDLRNGADETLAVDTAATGITAGYSSGVLTLTGPAALADFESVLRTLTYSNSSVDPGVGRTISIVATDTGSPAASSNPATLITLTITPDFGAPTLTNNGLTLNEGATANITPAQLSATDADTAEANLVFTVTSVPANGELLRDGTALSVGGTFTQADLSAGLMSYTHDGSETTSDSFGFSLTDGDTTPITGTFAITIVAVNNAPVIVLTSGATAYTPGGPAVVIDAGATVTDADSADFATGQLRVALSGNSAGDVLGIRNQGTGAGQIGVSGSNVTFGGTTIGTFTGGNGTPLVVTFNASATPAVAQALVRNITFVNTQATPAGGARTATFTISDGDGETSLPASKVITVELTTPNQPPVAANDSLTLPVNAGARVVNVLANDSDPDGDTLIITAVTQPANGTVTISGGGTNVTYTAPQDFSGTVSFTYTVSDGRGGTATATVTITVTDEQVQLFLPIQAAAPAPNQPDLVVSDIVVNPASPQAGTAAEVRVTLRNNGTAAASNFWVDLYINPSQAPGVNEPWNELCALDPCFGIAWFYTGTLAPGASVELISLPSTQAPNGFVAASSVWPGYFANGTNKLYAVVDSWNRDTTGGVRDPNGAVDESDETNNRAERDLTVAPGTLPQARSFPAPMSLPER